jgi:hypothetical protein
MNLNEKEQKQFRDLARSSYAPFLLTFIEKLVLELVDIRNIKGDNTDVERKGREVAVAILDRELVNRLKVLSGRIETSNNNEYV